jgi:hypothetical protein
MGQPDLYGGRLLRARGVQKRGGEVVGRIVDFLIQ